MATSSPMLKAPPYKQGTHPLAYEDCVPQGVADGHIAVVAHGREQEAVVDGQGEEEEHLGGAASQGDGLVKTRKAAEHPRNNDQCVHGLGGGEHTKEEVHGRVEATSKADNRHNDDIASQS